MLCHAISEQVVYSQHKIILSQQQPSIGATWIHLKLVRIRPFRCGCSNGMQHPKHAPDHLCKLIFSFLFFLPKSKGKRTPSHPNGLSCAHAQGVTWHIGAGEEQRVSRSRQISHPAVELDDIPTDHYYHQKMLYTFMCLHISTIQLCILCQFFHVCDLRKAILIEKNEAITKQHIHIFCLYATVLRVFRISGGLFQFVLSIQ